MTEAWGVETLPTEGSRRVKTPERTVRLAYVVSHPIQYQEPLLRRLAREPGLDLTVYYSSDFSVRSYRDRGFGREVQWEIPLLQGYKYKILPRLPGMKNISTAKPPSLGYLRQFLGGRYDVVWVHGYATMNSLHALLAARLTGAKTLLRSDSTLLDRERTARKKAVRRLFFAGLRPLVDGVLSVGTRNSEYWQTVLGPRVPQWTMPYAVDNEYFAARAESAAGSREELRAELGLDPGRAIFLFAAKLVARKRCADLLGAYALLRRKHLESRTAQPLPYLLVVGDGAERAALEQRAKEIDGDGIRFAGFRSQAEMPRFYDLCDVFILPSVHEPWGLAVNEAMASRRVVVVSDEVGCQPDLVLDGETGLVFRARDAQSLANCLARLLAEPGLAQRLAESGRSRIGDSDFEADVRALRRAIKEVRE